MLFKKYILMEEAGSAGGSSAAPATPSAPITQAGSSPVKQSESSEPAPQGGSAPAASSQPAKPETFEVKVNGKVVKMTRDEIIQHASLGLASDQRFKEAAQLRKQAESVISKLRNPDSVIEALMDPSLGLSKDQIREKFEEWYSREYIEPEQLTPEQRKMKEYEAQIKKYADAEKEREAQKAKDHEDSLTTQAREQIQNEIIAALDTGKLSRTNGSMRRLAKWIQINNANGFNAPTEVLVAQVRKEISQEVKDLTEASDGEVLISLLGDQVIQKLRKYDLEQLRKRRGGGGQQQEVITPPAETKSREPVDVNARIRELQRTGRY